MFTRRQSQKHPNVLPALDVKKAITMTATPLNISRSPNFRSKFIQEKQRLALRNKDPPSDSPYKFSKHLKTSSMALAIERRKSSLAESPRLNEVNQEEILDEQPIPT
jgi:hypothetical protein